MFHPECVTSELALRLVVAYGLAEGAMAPLPKVERPPYVTYCEDVGVREYTVTSRELIEQAAELWAQGMSMKRIAIRLRVPYWRIDSAIKRHRDLFPHRNRRRAAS